MKGSNITTVQILKETRNLLRNLGQRNEDFDSIINRAISGEFAGRVRKPQKKIEVEA